MGVNPIEEKRKMALNQARKIGELVGMPGLSRLAQDVAHPAMRLATRSRFGKYWPILIVAAIFDVIALIPFVSVVVNFCFGVVMFLYFGRKRIVAGIIAPIVIGSIIDFLISILPVNLAAAAIRIALKETVE